MVIPLKCGFCDIRPEKVDTFSTLAIFQLPRIFQNHASDLSAPKSCILTFFNKGESLTRLLIKHNSYLKDFPVLTYAMNGALGILYFFPTLCIGNNSEYSSALFLSVDGEMPRTTAASDVLRKLFVDFSISSKLLFFK